MAAWPANANDWLPRQSILIVCRNVSWQSNMADVLLQTPNSTAHRSASMSSDFYPTSTPGPNRAILSAVPGWCRSCSVGIDYSGAIIRHIIWETDQSPAYLTRMCAYPRAYYALAVRSMQQVGPQQAIRLRIGLHEPPERSREHSTMYNTCTYKIHISLCREIEIFVYYQRSPASTKSQLQPPRKRTRLFTLPSRKLLPQNMCIHYSIVFWLPTFHETANSERRVKRGLAHVGQNDDSTMIGFWECQGRVYPSNATQCPSNRRHSGGVLGGRITPFCARDGDCYDRLRHFDRVCTKVRRHARRSQGPGLRHAAVQTRVRRLAVRLRLPSEL